MHKCSVIPLSNIGCRNADGAVSFLCFSRFVLFGRIFSPFNFCGRLNATFVKVVIEQKWIKVWVGAASTNKNINSSQKRRNCICVHFKTICVQVKWTRDFHCKSFFIIIIEIYDNLFDTENVWKQRFSRWEENVFVW